MRVYFLVLPGVQCVAVWSALLPICVDFCTFSSPHDLEVHIPSLSYLLRLLCATEFHPINEWWYC